MWAVYESYTRTLRYKYIRYDNVITVTIINHLYTGSARIIQGGLEENPIRLKEEWYPNQATEAQFDQIEDAIDYTASGSTPYYPKQIISSAYNLVSKTVIFK